MAPGHLLCFFTYVFEGAHMGKRPAWAFVLFEPMMSECGDPFPQHRAVPVALQVVDGAE